MPSLLSILAGTPWWVWVLFIYLLMIGVNSLYDRTVHVYRLGVMPTIFFVWSFYSLSSKPFIFFLLWMAFCFVGILINARSFSRLPISINKSGLVRIPGSLTPLILSLLFFALKYFLGVSYALNPMLKFNVLVTSFDVGLSGFIAGIAWGRFLSLFYRYYKA